MTRLLASTAALTLAAAQGTRDTFHGQFSAQKYAPADQITPEDVGDLERQWTVYTGDMPDGAGELPPTVWSATPIYANDTLYLGTPFYRILALDRPRASANGPMTASRGRRR